MLRLVLAPRPVSAERCDRCVRRSTSDAVKLGSRKCSIALLPPSAAGMPTNPASDRADGERHQRDRSSAWAIRADHATAVTACPGGVERCAAVVVLVRFGRTVRHLVIGAMRLSVRVRIRRMRRAMDHGRRHRR